MTIALMLAAMLTMVKIAMRLPATNPNRCSATMSVSRPLQRRQVADGHRVEVERVERHVDRHDADRAEPQRKRHVTARMTNLLGDVRRGVPPGVREHDRHAAPAASPCSRLATSWAPARLPNDPWPHPNPSVMKTSSAETFAPARMLCTTRPDPCRWTNDSATIAAMATSAWRRHDKIHDRDRQPEQRRLAGGGRHEAADVLRERDGAGGNRARESRHERRPAGEKRRHRSVRVPQIDVFAAGMRAQGRQFGVRHGAGKREQAAEDPHADHRRAGRDEPRDDDRHEEDAAADDVGHDDRGGVERPEPAFQGDFRRA